MPEEIWIEVFDIVQEPDPITCLLRKLYVAREATVRIGHEQLTGSKIGKEYAKPVYCHSGHLTYM